MNHTPQTQNVDVTLLVAGLSIDVINALRDEANRTGQDLHQLVAAKVLDVDYGDVTVNQRTQAKHGLFSHLYGRSLAFGCRGTRPPIASEVGRKTT